LPALIARPLAARARARAALACPLNFAVAIPATRSFLYRLTRWANRDTVYHMRLLTLKPPWAHLVAHCGKNVENRSWFTPYRGPILIHASQSVSGPAYREVGRWLASRRLPELPPIEALVCGAVIAVATLSDVRQKWDSPWYAPGAFGWLLSDVRPLSDPIRCRGALKLTRPDPAVLTRIAQLGYAAI
jgi:hypothetical protein